MEIKTIMKIFAIFTQNYGGLWTSRCANEQEWEMCSKLWEGMLCEFKEIILEKSLKRAIEQFVDRPPTIGQFKEICKLIVEENRFFNQPKKIEEIEVNPSDFQKNEIKKIKSILSRTDSVKKRVCVPQKGRDDFLFNLEESQAIDLAANDQFDRLRIISERKLSESCRPSMKHISKASNLSREMRKSKRDSEQPSESFNSYRARKSGFEECHEA